AIRHTVGEDLYLLYAGKNLDNDKPIIKAHLNPLVSWIWIGALMMLAGTLVALVPNLPASALAKKPTREVVHVAEPEPVGVAQ
ncbi:MAG TPA: cytochrome c-type biogenesis CcmF C-terminal domain-containing protein, partial [Terriglobales bacterium]|nr:cytochrome c-type biogenesis CcmF C-terminal domain-containing protein [Terriglobales bacterium]